MPLLRTQQPWIYDDYCYTCYSTYCTVLSTPVVRRTDCTEWPLWPLWLERQVEQLCQRSTPILLHASFGGMCVCVHGCAVIENMAFPTFPCFPSFSCRPQRHINRCAVLSEPMAHSLGSYAGLKYFVLIKGQCPDRPASEPDNTNREKENRKAEYEVRRNGCSAPEGSVARPRLAL